MPKSFIVAPLPKTQTDQALPVVQVLHRNMTLEQWRDVAAPFLEPDPERGVMACSMSDGHIRGLFCWVVHQDGEARVLNIPTFIAVGLFDAAVTSAALIEAIDGLARQLGCHVVEVERQGCVVAATAPAQDTAGLFARLGYHADRELLVKDIGAAADYPVAGVA
ncbi:hypothetical protein [Azospirillum sp. sgz302134]